MRQNTSSTYNYACSDMISCVNEIPPNVSRDIRDLSVWLSNFILSDNHINYWKIIQK